MFSRLLIKLIDQAIVPAILLLSVRLISIIGVSKYMNIPFELTNNGFTFADPNEYVVINSYSTLFMMVVLSVGLFFILIKAYVFHESHISPDLSAKLFTLKLTSFVQASFDLYSQGAVWLSYTYLLTAITGVMSVFGLVYMWVFIVGIILSVISTVLLILDVENELIIKTTKGADFDNEELYLEEYNEIYA